MAETNINNARAFIKQGFYVFPCRWAGGGYKFLTKWKSQQNGSTNSLKQLEKWHEKWHDAFFCINLEKSEHWVIDIDLKNGKDGLASIKEWERKNGKLPKTFTVKTPSGGFHLYFKGVAKPIQSQFGKGVDIPAMVPIPGNTPKGDYTIFKNHRPAPLPPNIKTTKIKGDIDPGLPETSNWNGKLSSLNLDDSILNYITQGMPKGQRSEACYAVIATLIEAGLTEQDIKEIFNHYPIGERYRKRQDALTDDIKRVAIKINPANDFDRETGKAKEFSLAWLNERHAKMAYGGKVLVWTRTESDSEGVFYVPYSTVEFNKIYEHRFRMVNDKAVPLGLWWRKHPKHMRCKAEGFILDPRKKPGPTRMKGSLNLWRGWGIKPQKGDCEDYQRLIKALCAWNTSHAIYVTKWLAYLLQNPTAQHKTALVFIGEKGTGKSTLGLALKMILGGHAARATSADQVVGRFNSHLRDKVFLLAEEIKWLQSQNGAGALKSLITDPECSYEAKGLPIVNGRNYISLMITTNEDWAVPASIGDERRYVVLRVSNDLRHDIGLWDRLYNVNSGMLNKEQLAAFAYRLLKMNISDFIPLREAPKTTALSEQALESMSYSERWYYNCLLYGNLPGGEARNWRKEQVGIEASVVYEDYTSSVPSNRHRSSIQAIGLMLSRFGVERQRATTIRDGIRPWLRVFPSLVRARKLFCDKLGMEIEW